MDPCHGFYWNCIELPNTAVELDDQMSNEEETYDECLGFIQIILPCYVGIFKP